MDDHDDDADDSCKADRATLRDYIYFVLLQSLTRNLLLVMLLWLLLLMFRF